MTQAAYEAAASQGHLEMTTVECQECEVQVALLVVPVAGLEHGGLVDPLLAILQGRNKSGLRWRPCGI